MMRLSLLLVPVLLAALPGFSQKGAAPAREVLADSILSRKDITPGRNQLLLMVEREQKKADVSDGEIDQRLDLLDDMQLNNALSDAIFKKVNTTIAYIENNPNEDLQKRKLIGRVIENLKMLNSDLNDGQIDIPYYVSLFEHTYQVMRGLNNHNLPVYVRAHVGKQLYLLSPLFDTDKESMEALLADMADKDPELLTKKLRTIKVETAADIVVARCAPGNPKAILNYATSTAVERDIIRRNKDPYVKAIVRIADSCTTPLRAVFFVEDMMKGTLSIAQINAMTADDDVYFKKMVELRPKYLSGNRRKSYDKEMAYNATRFVFSMNELHEAADAVRFKSIEKLTAVELYYVMVYGSDDLYTSSFLGCYNRLMARMKPKRGDEFLNDLNKDKFRTFIRLCANYNTLSPFLSSVKAANQPLLMRSFVSGLDSTSEQDLEGATDVANSFGSIQDSLLMGHIIDEIHQNRTKDSANKNIRGFRIYDILYTMLTASNDSITKKYGIPPITVMPYRQLANDSGIVYQQVFFFGDEDGKGVFNSYVNGFSPNDWKVKREDKWVEISSIKGKPVVIYANKPLDEPEDEMAQNALQDYLDSLHIRPTIIIHRGHSYHLPGTLEHINYRHKVVILGACGAYQNLAAVLNASEEAQIVSTKQIGSGKINGPIIRAFNQRLLDGRDIDWVELWAQLGKQFSSPDTRDLFNDYVPPFRNLGALFLKAYRKMEMSKS